MSSLVIIDASQAGAEKSAVRVVAAAAKLGATVDVWLVGTHANAMADAVNTKHVSNIITYNPAGWGFPSAEQVSDVIADKLGGYSNYMVAANSFGKDMLPRLALRLDVQPVTDIIEIISPTQFKRPIYAGNVVVEVQDVQPVKCLSIRPTAFEADEAGGNAALEVLEAELPQARVVYEPMVAPVDAVIDITSAAMVVAAGNGIGTKEKFAQVEALAAKLGAGVGASRALVDAGVVPNEYQIGQTGKVVAPDLYIALGISGAIQHIAGMKDSGTIVAVNKDPNAPIFDVADYKLVADLDEVLPELLGAF